MCRQSWQSKRTLDLLGPRLRFSWFYVVNGCSPVDPGSNPGWAKLWVPTAQLPLDKNEWFLPCLWIQIISVRSQTISEIAVILSYIMLAQNTPKSYHNLAIDQEWLWCTVFTGVKFYSSRNFDSWSTLKYMTWKPTRIRNDKNWIHTMRVFPILILKPTLMFAKARRRKVTSI